MTHRKAASVNTPGPVHSITLARPPCFASAQLGTSGASCGSWARAADQWGRPCRVVLTIRATTSRRMGWEGVEAMVHWTSWSGRAYHCTHENTVSYVMGGWW